MSCNECKYWSSFKGKKEEGQCRKYTPDVIPNVSGFPLFFGTCNETVWPETAFDDWCGEFEPLKEEEPNQ